MTDIISGIFGWFGDAIHTYREEIAAVSTALIALYTIRLFGIGRRQIKDTRVLQRAYLAVLPRGINPWRTFGDKYSCDVAFFNAGNLPAQNVSWEITREFSHERRRADFNLPNNEAGDVLIPPKGQMMKSAAPITTEEVQAATDELIGGETMLYVWGRVRYKDGFGNDRFIDFCHRYNVNNFSSAGVAAAYGRQHEYGNRTDEY
jgi:hypothetical protein